MSHRLPPHLSQLLSRGEELSRPLPPAPESLWSGGEEDFFCDVAKLGREPVSVASAALSETASRPLSWWQRALWAPSMAFAAGLALLVWSSAPQDAIQRPLLAPLPLPRSGPPRRGLTPKGAPMVPAPMLRRPLAATTTRLRFRFFVKRDHKTFEGKDGVQVQARDQIRFAYDFQPANPGEGRFVLLFLVDAKGKLSPLYPAKEGQRLALRRGRSVFLPDGIELDDDPRPERIFVCASQEPLSYRRLRGYLLDAVASRGLERQVSLPAGCQHQQSWLLRKGPAPAPRRKGRR